MKIQVGDAFGMDLVQAQENVPRNDLDLSEIERLSTSDYVLEKIRWTVRNLDLLFLLYLFEHSVSLSCIRLLVGALSYNLLHEGSTNEAGRLLRDEEVHIVRLIHVLDLAKVDGLRQVGERESLPDDKSFLRFVELGLLDGGECVHLGVVRDLSLSYRFCITRLP